MAPACLSRTDTMTQHGTSVRRRLSLSAISHNALIWGSLMADGRKPTRPSAMPHTGRCTRFAALRIMSLLRLSSLQKRLSLPP